MLKLSILITIILWTSFLVAHAEENSTYNFYFQKAPGPVTVNQGGAATSVKVPDSLPAPTTVTSAGPAVPAAAAPTATSVADMPSASEYKRWHLSIGYLDPIRQLAIEDKSIAKGETNLYLQNQVGVRVEYDLSHAFSLNAGIQSLRRKPDLSLGLDYDGVGGIHEVSKRHLPSELAAGLPQRAMDYSVGFAFHMVRSINDIFDLSLLGGIVTLPYLQYRELSRSAGRWVTAGPTGISHQTSPYGGLRMRILADRFWGVEASYKMAAGPRIGSFELASAFEF